MTTFEHAMVGATACLSTGVHRTYGWKIVAVAALAGISPDWDGLTLLVSNSAFAAGHRVWGHNLLAAVTGGILVAAVDYRWDVVTRIARLLIGITRLQLADATVLTVRGRDERNRRGVVWIATAVIAALLHLPSDLIVSGTDTLPDWKLPLLWPFSDRSWVYPLVQWGDPGITFVFVVGTFAMLRWKSHLQLIGALTLGGVVGYAVIFGLVMFRCRHIDTALFANRRCAASQSITRQSIQRRSGSFPPRAM